MVGWGDRTDMDVDLTSGEGALCLVLDLVGDNADDRFATDVDAKKGIYE